VNADMENLMPIGEFASASRLSQKALRLYSENGLLPPAWVDPDSGYRYYTPDQLREATLIAFLRRAAMPLGEIRSFLRDPSLDQLEATSGARRTNSPSGDGCSGRSSDC
jgi:PPM family protein phosphatase